MKKLKLKSIIKESIKELMTEQTGGGCSTIPAPSSSSPSTAWYNSSQPMVVACNGMLPGWFQGCPNCLTANNAALQSPPSNFQNMIQNLFNNQGCQGLNNWMSAPNHKVHSVGGSNAYAGRLFYPGENPIHQAKKMKKWKFTLDLYGQNC